MRSHATAGLIGQAVLVAGLMISGVAGADPVSNADFRYTFGISNAGVQLSNGAIKFQGRISQGKMPIPQGEIMSVSVKLLASGITKCSQDYGNLTVRGSILNLDFQPTNCVLDNIVALNPDLQFQLVINGSPLNPIAIGTVPYALKANYAVKAQEVHFADVAAQAHYAHRVTADRQALALAPDAGVGKGYFDFYTQPTGGSLYGTSYAQYANDGFLQWTPVAGAPVLHLAAKGVSSDQLAPLDGLHLESASTVAHGSVSIDPRDLGSPAFARPALTVVQGGADVTGLTKLNSGAEVSGGLLVKDFLGPTQALVCDGDAKVSKSLSVMQAASVGKELTVTGLSTMNGGAVVNGGLTVFGAPDAGALTSAGDAKVNGALTVGGKLYTADVGISQTLVVSKTSRFDSLLTSRAGITVESGGTLTVAGPSQFGQLPDGGASVSEFHGQVNFKGPVTITGTLTAAIPDDSVSSKKLKVDSVTNTAIAAGSITRDKIADGGVTGDWIAKAAVTTDKIALSAVTADRIRIDPPQWTNATLGAGYVNAYGLTTPSWYRDPFWRVQVRGDMYVQDGAPSAVIWTFPPGFRPAVVTRFFYGENGAVKMGRIEPTGEVTLSSIPGFMTWIAVAFDFLAEQ